MNNYAISAKNVSKKFRLYHEKRDSIFEAATSFFQKKQHYEILQALDDISFNVKHGEIFGIIGSNGAGKTTLLRIISKIYGPDSGSVDVQGTIIPVLALGLGFHPELTAVTNIYQSSILLGYSKNEISQRVDDIIKFAALGSRLATGSSANSNFGFFIIALAIPIRCLCPPESSSARLYALSKSPTVSNAFKACNFCSFVNK